jgi:hypothetical protein
VPDVPEDESDQGHDEKDERVDLCTKHAATLARALDGAAIGA